MSNPMTITDDRLREIVAGCEGVTPGPWQVSRYEHPYGTGSKAHQELRISSLWEHPQSKQCIVVTRLAIGVGLAGQPPIPMIRIEDSDADHLSRCDPETIRDMATELLAAREELAKAREQEDRYEHVVDMWADTACNAVQWLKNVRDEIAKPIEALADIAPQISKCHRAWSAIRSRGENYE